MASHSASFSPMVPSQNYNQLSTHSTSNTMANLKSSTAALQTDFHTLWLSESIRSQLQYEIQLQLWRPNLMGRNLSVFLWSPKEEPTYINDTIHSTCRQIHPRDRQKYIYIYILTHQGERRIRLHRAYTKNKFNILPPHLTSISYNKNLAP